MTDTERLAIFLRLREASESLGRLFENVGLDSAPLVCLNEASVLADLASEIQSAFVKLSRQPGETLVSGGAIRLGDLVEVDDKGAQRAMAEQWAYDNERLEKARAEAGIAALLDDTAPAHSSDRDARGAA
jgi:hypothetical protein